MNTIKTNNVYLLLNDIRNLYIKYYLNKFDKYPSRKQIENKVKNFQKEYIILKEK